MFATSTPNTHVISIEIFGNGQVTDSLRASIALPSRWSVFPRSIGTLEPLFYMQALERIRAEYLEMPGMRLTRQQVRRLTGF